MRLSYAAIFTLVALGAGLFSSQNAHAGNCCADLEERIAELEATTIRKGNRKVSLQLSGMATQAIYWSDDQRAAFEGQMYVLEQEYGARPNEFFIDFQAIHSWSRWDSATQIRLGNEDGFFENDANMGRQNWENSWSGGVRLGFVGTKKIAGMNLGRPFVEGWYGDSDDRSTIFEGKLDGDEDDPIDTRVRRERNESLWVQIGTIWGVIPVYRHPDSSYGISLEPWSALGVERIDTTYHFWTDATNDGQDYDFSRSETNTNFIVSSGVDTIIDTQWSPPFILKFGAKYNFRNNERITVPGNDDLWRFGDQVDVFTGDQGELEIFTGIGLRFGGEGFHGFHYASQEVP